MEKQCQSDRRGEAGERGRARERERMGGGGQLVRHKEQERNRIERHLEQEREDEGFRGTYRAREREDVKIERRIE